MRASTRVAVIGVGGIGSAYVEAVTTAEDLRLTAVHDVRPETARAVAERVGADVALQVDSLADPATVDLAIICTPPDSHEHLTTRFLRAGVPVLCEKPLAPDSAGARRIAEVADQTGTPFTMASKFRYVPDVAQAREIVQSGDLGELVRIEVAFSGRVDMRHRWNGDRQISGGGVLIDNGTHAVDIVRYVLGPIDAVLAACMTVTPGLEVEDTASMLVRTEGGALGSVDVSWASDWITPRFLAVFGTEGSLEVGWRGSRLRRSVESADVAFGDGYSKISALTANVRNVSRALLNLEEMRVTTADAVASTDVIAAGYVSTQTGGWVDVPATRMALVGG